MRVVDAGVTAIEPGFAARLLRIDPRARDAWVDGELGFGDVPDDGADLPRGCVPYLPSSVASLLRVIEGASIGPEDVFVDVGSGLGRAMMLVHLLTGAAAVGIEVQADLAEAATRRADALGLDRVRTLHGDAAELTGSVELGSVFFFYSPFGSERMLQVLEAIRPLARVRPLRFCFVDTPPPELPWMKRDAAVVGEGQSVAICRTQLSP